MKDWWQKVVKNYFTFSAKERNGLLFFCIAGIAVFIIFRWWPVSQPAIKNDAFQKELATLKITVDSSSRSFHNNYHRNSEEEFNDYDHSNHYEHWASKKGELFTFDPNTLDAEGWARLGLKEKTIRTIQNFVSKGFKFKKPEDLQKIYGLQAQDVARLLPYVRIEAKEEDSKITTVKYDNTSKPVYKNVVIDINTADTSAFIALPGIGSKLANRIVLYRQKLGGFFTVAQLGETFGLPDSIFQKIKTRMECNNPSVKQISINTSDATQLKAHPYIRWNTANAIINYRTQHGNFTALEDLKKIDIINEELFQKLKPYLSL